MAGAFGLAAGLVGTLADSIMRGKLAKKQKERAENLKVSDYVPESLKENKALFGQRMQSGTAPGQAHRESQIRRGGASTAAKVRRLAGGDAGKAIAGVAAVGEQTQDALATEGNKGLAYSDAQTTGYARNNLAIGRVQEQNQRNYEREKSALEGASIQNKYGAWMNAFGGAQMLGSYLDDKGVKFPSFGGKKGGGPSVPSTGATTSVADVASEVYDPWATDPSGAYLPGNYNFIGGQSEVGGKITK